MTDQVQGEKNKLPILRMKMLYHFKATDIRKIINLYANNCDIETKLLKNINYQNICKEIDILLSIKFIKPIIQNIPNN